MHASAAIDLCMKNGKLSEKWLLEYESELLSEVATCYS